MTRQPGATFNAEESNMTMNASHSETTDPICGMRVDVTSPLHVARDGKTFYICSTHCRDKFLSAPTSGTPAKKSKGCCE